jgi:hypothetical protein
LKHQARINRHLARFILVASAANGILYQISGSTEVSLGGEVKMLSAGEGLFIAGGNSDSRPAATFNASEIRSDYAEHRIEANRKNRQAVAWQSDVTRAKGLSGSSGTGMASSSSAVRNASRNTKITSIGNYAAVEAGSIRWPDRGTSRRRA